MNKKLKVAIAFNEANPDLYVRPAITDPKEMNFVPYFEVENLTPIEEYEILVKRLNSAGFDAYSFNLQDDLNSLLIDVKKNKPDVIFNFIELYKENSRLEMNMVGVLELLGIPYTGAPPISLANCQNKVLAKRILNTQGINTPKFMLVKENHGNLKHNLKFPLIVKPAFEDASVGIENDSIVENNKQLLKRINYVHQSFLQPALIEEFIEGRELNVAIFGNSNPVALPISEIDFSQMPEHLFDIVSYQAKWDPNHEAYHKTIPSCPANLPIEIEMKAKEIAIASFKAMECRDYCRVDMRLTKDNEIFVLEVNPNPDLTEGAGFMRSAEAAGYTFDQVLEKIIGFALDRKN